jgi:hypothetical protein
MLAVQASRHTSVDGVFAAIFASFSRRCNPRRSFPHYLFAGVLAVAHGKIGVFFNMGASRLNPPADTHDTDRGAPLKTRPAGCLRPSHVPLRWEGTLGMHTHLKIYRGPVEVESRVISKNESGEDTVTVSFGEILPLIVDAVESQRTWLGDFELDDVTISRDLYEVLSAYQYFRRPTA